MARPRAAGSRRIWLVRHGITAWNAEGRWQGAHDVALSADGRAQAEALGRRLADVALSEAFSSGLSRAHDTARLATQERLDVQDEPLLRELSYGIWEGITDAEVGRRWPEERAAWWSAPHATRPGGGESLEELAARAWAGLVACAARSTGDVLVVAHGGVNRVLLARILGAPLSRFWTLQQSPTGVSVLEFGPGPIDESLAGARVLVLNCTRHLDRDPAIGA